MLLLNTNAIILRLQLDRCTNWWVVRLEKDAKIVESAKRNENVNNIFITITANKNLNVQTDRVARRLLTPTALLRQTGVVLDLLNVYRVRLVRVLNIDRLGL
jgi:hypothetical protein